MLRNYITIALRSLRRHSTYTAINIIGLTFGLAACWFIVLFVADELSFDRFNTKADRIVRVVQHTRWNGNDLRQATTSAPFASALQAAFPEIEDAVRIDLEGGGVLNTGKKKIKQGDIIFADRSLLNIFSYDFLAGDAKTALSTPRSIVITESLAKALFGSVDLAINQVVRFEDNTPNTVTAIIREIPANAHLRFSAVRSFDDNFTSGWQNFYLYTYLLLKPGVDSKALEQKLPAFAAGTIQQMMKVSDYRMELQPLTDIHLHSALAYEPGENGSIRRVYIFSAIALLILGIAVINYINLSTARSAARVREIGVRKVIGSEKRHIAGMFITEALLVTFAAALLAGFMVQLALPLLNELSGKRLDIWRFKVWPTLAAIAGFAITTGLAAGVYPSLVLSRFRTIPALKGQVGSLGASVLVRESLVVVQFVITVVMITGSVVIYQQLDFARHKDLGFNKDQVLTFHIDDRAVRSQVPALKASLRQRSLIEGAAAAGNPIGNNDLGGMGYYFEEEGGGMSTSSVMAQELMVDADYLPTMMIGLSAGRNFSPDRPGDQYGAALVNQTLVRKMQWKHPIGKKITFRLQDSTVLERQVIGVVNDFHTYSLQHRVDPLVMVMPAAPSMQDNLYVRIAKGKVPEGLAFLEKTYKQFDPSNQASFTFLDQNFARQYLSEEKQGKIALLFTGLAIVIAALGLFGLATFTASQRTREIGLRKVLGASVANIVNMLSKDFLKLVGLSILIAAPLAWFIMTKWLQDFEYRINVPWWTIAGAGLAAACIALATISVRALKAAHANPTASLRSE